MDGSCQACAGRLPMPHLHASCNVALVLLFALGRQGGASTQFSAIPLNLAAEDATVDYIVTGSWSKKAAGGEPHTFVVPIQHLDSLVLAAGRSTRAWLSMGCCSASSSAVPASP